jgi:hypothetical protein
LAFLLPPFLSQPPLTNSPSFVDSSVDGVAPTHDPTPSNLGSTVLFGNVLPEIFKVDKKSGAGAVIYLGFILLLFACCSCCLCIVCGALAMKYKKSKALEERELTMQRYKIFNPQISTNSSTAAAKKSKTRKSFEFVNLIGMYNVDPRAAHTTNDALAGTGIDLVPLNSSISAFYGDTKSDKKAYDDGANGTSSRIFDNYYTNIQAFPFLFSNSPTPGKDSSDSPENGKKPSVSSILSYRNNRKSAGSATRPDMVSPLHLTQPYYPIYLQTTLH